MSMTGRRWPRYFAILVALIMIVETIAFTLTSYAKNETDMVYVLTDQDKNTVSEISNMTGVKADEIIKLRKEGKTWNQILELIKYNSAYKAEQDGTTRQDTLVKNGMEEDTINKLKEDGFTEEEISEAKSLVERIIFQLDELTNMQAAVPSLPGAQTDINNKREAETLTYTTLAGKINLSKAVYLVLKLRDELGSMKAVLDEYLCSLQLGIDLNRYLDDKEGYRKMKQQKLAELIEQDIITSDDIEAKMLDKLQSMNKKDEAVPEIKTVMASLPEIENENPLPDVQVPDIQDIKPQNPAEAIMQEISGITENNNEQDWR